MDNPLADVMFGVDDTFLTRAVDAGIFEPFTSSLPRIRFRTACGPTADLVTPIDYGDVCLNYDKAAFSDSCRPRRPRGSHRPCLPRDAGRGGSHHVLPGPGLPSVDHRRVR